MKTVPHKTDARKDMNMQKFISVWEVQGYGSYWILREIAAGSLGMRIKIKESEDRMLLSKDLDYNPAQFNKFLEDLNNKFHLIKSDGEFMWFEDMMKKEKPVPDVYIHEFNMPEKNEKDPDNLYLRMVRWFYDELYKVNPELKSLKTATVFKWYQDVKRLIEIDKRNPKEAANLFGWAMIDEFWMYTLQSPSGFRKHYDKIYNQYQRKA